MYLAKDIPKILTECLFSATIKCLFKGVEMGEKFSTLSVLF